MFYKPQCGFYMPGLDSPGVLNVHAYIEHSLAEGVIELLDRGRTKDFLSLWDENFFIFLTILLRMINCKFR